MKTENCPLCFPQGEKVVAETGKFRVIRVGDPLYPAYFRVIWNDHVREMSDLSAADRRLLMEAVNTVEETVREVFSPVKINLAQFGTMVPHVHWHIIGRWPDDAAYPDSVWSPVRRECSASVLEERKRLALLASERIRARFSA